MKVKLGDICDIFTGGTPSRAVQEYWQGGTTPWVKISDLKNKYINFTEEYITEEGLKHSSAKLFKKGTVLYSIFATLGETSILKIDAATNQAIAGLNIKDNRVSTDYLYYYLLSQKDNIAKLGRGVAQNNINLKILKDFELNIPCLLKQDIITKILDLVCETISKRKQQLEKLDLLIKSQFNEMFGDPISNPKGWHTKGLLDLGTCKNGMNFGSMESGVTVKCIGVGDIQDKYSIDGGSGISLVDLNEIPSQSYLLEDKDIVFVRSNGNKNLVGRCVIVYVHNEPITFSGFCIRYRNESKETKPIFILHLLKQESVRARIVGRGANIQNLNQKILSELKIVLPPIELQKEFAIFVEQTDKSKLKTKQSLEKLETLKKSLMQKYFG